MLDVLREKASWVVHIDTNTLIFVCVLQRKEVYNKGGYPLAIMTPKITPRGLAAEAKVCC